jgi:hypothetical protein
VTLKYEGDKVSRIAPRENGGDTISYLAKMFFGNDPSQWVRFVILGAVITAAYFMMRDFKREIVSESAAVRRSLSEYVAANEQWQRLSNEERARLVARVDARIRRLYLHNGWEYIGITE